MAPSQQVCHGIYSTFLKEDICATCKKKTSTHIIKDKYDTTLNEDLRYKGKSRYLRDRILVILMRWGLLSNFEVRLSYSICITQGEPCHWFRKDHL